MWGLALLMMVSTPAAPVPVEPVDGAWVPAVGLWFDCGPYDDDAGSPLALLELDYRRDDGGYGGLSEATDSGTSLVTALQLGADGTGWCWQATFVNGAGQRSSASAERCLRVDSTAPTSATNLDAGPATSTGTVTVTFTPGTDALSGLAGFALCTAPAVAGPWNTYLFPSAGPPLVKGLGPGTWYGGVISYDLALNDDRNAFFSGGQVVRFDVVAQGGVPTPPAPAWDQPVNNGYGQSLVFDLGWAQDAGVDQVVSSFCEVDAGCVWQLGYLAVPIASAQYAWVQVSDEGFYLARVAVLKAGLVGQWSAPSGVTIIDRTPPSTPGTPTATLLSADAGAITLTWAPAADTYTGVAGYTVEETELTTAATRQLAAPSAGLDVTPLGWGQFQFRVKARDGVGLESGWSGPSNVLNLGSGDGGSPPADGGAATSDGGAAVPDGGAVASDGGTVVADGGTLASDGGATGSPLRLRLDCGCSGTSGLDLLAVAVAVALAMSARRRKREGGSPA